MIFKILHCRSMHAFMLIKTYNVTVLFGYNYLSIVSPMWHFLNYVPWLRSTCNMYLTSLILGSLKNSGKILNFPPQCLLSLLEPRPSIGFISPPPFLKCIIPTYKLPSWLKIRLLPVTFYSRLFIFVCWIIMLCYHYICLLVSLCSKKNCFCSFTSLMFP